MAYDSSGNLYMISYYEEDCCTLRRINAANISTGLTAWEGLRDGGRHGDRHRWHQCLLSRYCSDSGNILSYNASTGAADHRVDARSSLDQQHPRPGRR